MDCRTAALAGKRRSSFGKERVPLAQRFWSKVDRRGDDECWRWTGAVDGYGYGYLGNRRRPNHKAHRLSYEIHFGTILEGLCVCHHCDNPPCVNPKHLFLGTLADNNEDRKRKGRNHDRRGDKNSRAKLGWDDVRLIRELRSEGMSQQCIAERFGVCQVTVSKIVRGQTWKELEV